ncbi:MAG: MMPL family transporter [Alphaproteobacteria bacterium]|nr:MMPL family transporter [Alphaproteobacteria bacterium]
MRLRAAIVLAMLVATALLGWQAARLQVDAGFQKFLPLSHPYMATFLAHQEEFGGANRVLVVLRAREGDIFTAPFLDTLARATDAAYRLPGIDRARVTSLFTPNVRFIDIVEDGFVGGNVIPSDFRPTPDGLARVRENTLKSGQVGRLVATDFSAAAISLQLLDRDPRTGHRLDTLAIARALETELRQPFTTATTEVHILGFAKLAGDIADGATGVLGFFAVSLVLTAGLVFLYARSIALTVVPLLCSGVAVVWMLGGLTLLNFGLDPMSILLPFLVFAIGVSHAVQVINRLIAERLAGSPPQVAAANTLARLLVPASVALATDTAGFLTLLVIDIPIIQELAVAASLGVAAILLTNLLLLPLVVSYLPDSGRWRHGLAAATHRVGWFWDRLAAVVRPRAALTIVTAALALLVWGWVMQADLRIGDSAPGAPELRANSRYNQDVAEITRRFAIGVDVLTVIVETVPNACVDPLVMATIDRFQLALAETAGVQSTASLTQAAKLINAGWNEGALKWRTLPADPRVLVRAVTPIETASGLLNADCSVMPILAFMTDHKADTINHVVATVEMLQRELDRDGLRFRLATGNVGVMAATNEAVSDAQLPMLAAIYAVIAVLCLAMFRSLTATVCIILPLMLVSVLCNATMALLGIGLKVATLPVAALGVGIGVDYGIYTFSTLLQHLRAGVPFAQAYRQSLEETGAAVLFTGVTLSLGVATWVASALKFQADLGLLLAFMFLVNMAGALFLAPALAACVWGRGARATPAKSHQTETRAP